MDKVKYLILQAIYDTPLNISEIKQSHPTLEGIRENLFEIHLTGLTHKGFATSENDLYSISELGKYEFERASPKPININTKSESMPFKTADYKSEDDKFKDALAFIEELFPYLPEHGDFTLFKKIHELNKQNNQLKTMLGCQRQIQTILKDYDYIEPGTFNSQIKLTKTGRAAKACGGHKQYQELLKEEQERAKKPISPTFNVSGDVIGSVIGDGQLSQKDFRSPLKQQTTNITHTDTNKRSKLETANWILGIIAVFLLIYEFVLKHFFHVNFLW